MKKKQIRKPSGENSPSNFQEYQHNGEAWVVEAFDKLTGLYAGLTEPHLPVLHALAGSRADFKTGWEITRRLCGIREAIPPLGADLDTLGKMSEADVAAAYRISVEELSGQMAMLQLAWQQLLCDDDTPSSQAVPMAKDTTPMGRPRMAAPVERILTDLTEDQLELLNLAAFPSSVFDFDGHTPSDRRMEISWFCDRIEEVRKVLEEPMAKGPLQNALHNQLQLRRINHKLVMMDSAGKEYMALQNTKAQIEEGYRKQWEQVMEICPDAVRAIDRKRIISSISDIIKLWQEFKANPLNQERDGIFTDEEFQILTRQSAQNPEMQYRAGWILAANEAKLHIGDPNFKRSMTPEQCKILDTSWAWAANKLSERMNMPRPDLEKEGEVGEYPEIYSDPTGDITEPDIAGLTAPEEESAEVVEISEPIAS